MGAKKQKKQLELCPKDKKTADMGAKKQKKTAGIVPKR